VVDGSTSHAGLQELIVMKKGITICFRTSEELRDVLKKISAEDRRSMSTTIETIIYESLAARKEIKDIKDEKRRFPRKKVSIPTLVQKPHSEDKQFQAGIIIDLSLGGVRISIPSESDYEIRENRETSRIEIIFPLSDSKRPLAMQCMPRTVVDENGEVKIGASFVDSDFSSIQTLQNYLIQ
jgi:hypothetical protein